MGTQTVYDEALPTTVVLVDELPNNKNELFVIEQFNDSSALIALPRYDKFNNAIADLAERGCSFKEIAGNTSAILLTILVTKNNDKPYQKAKIVFTQPFASDPKLKRICLAIPVIYLHELLTQLKKEKTMIEHVFDY